MWVVRVVGFLAIVAFGNVLLYRYGAPGWLAKGFNIGFLSQLLWAIPAWRNRKERGGPCATVDQCLDCLRRAGWSCEEAGIATRWVVSGRNGENVIRAEGQTRAEAWSLACEQARAVGAATPPRKAEGP